MLNCALLKHPYQLLVLKKLLDHKFLVKRQTRMELVYYYLSL